MKPEYEVIATHMSEEGMFFAVKTEDKPGLVFSFENVHVARDEDGNEFLDFQHSILGKTDIKEDLTSYAEDLFVRLLTDNTDLNPEDLLPEHQL